MTQVERTAWGRLFPSFDIAALVAVGPLILCVSSPAAATVGQAASDQEEVQEAAAESEGQYARGLLGGQDSNEGIAVHTSQLIERRRQGLAILNRPASRSAEPYAPSAASLI